MDLYTVSEEKRKNLAEVLRKARENKKLGLNQLAVKTDIQSSILSRLENGKILKINPYLLRRIAEGLKLDYRELYKIVGYLEESEAIEKGIGTIVNTDRVPLFESISAGCGFESAEAIDFILVPELKCPENYFAVKVKGDSMEGTIPDGSIIIIKKDEEIPDGRIGAFIIDSGAVVKRIRRNKNENILWSDNTSYPPITVKKGDQYHECGRVVKVLLDL